jgi:serine protease inhibitor
MKIIRSPLRRKEVLFLCLILLLYTMVNLTSCLANTPGVQAEDLMGEVKAGSVIGKEIDNQFINNTADFTIKLFHNSIDKEKNSLVSPLSVMLALAMTANGADGSTLEQMEEVLGNGITLEELNQYLYYYANNLPSEEKSRFKIANSLWFRDDENRLTVEKDFLQKNADYYNAAIYKAPFTDETLNDINDWVKINTDDMIDKILDEIHESAVMYLINAIVFDAEWKVIYNESNIYEDTFYLADGTKKTVDFMRSEESLFLDDGRATGFIKPYYDDKYSFAALLPNEGISLDSYIESLSGEGLLDTVADAEMVTVNATMPKFSYEYEIQLNEILKSMGMPAAFDSNIADFSRMGKSSRGNIFIGDVLHKTFISLDEKGTRAGAVTKVEIRDESAALDLKFVKLDRPFVYAIIDNSTNLPVFIGTVINPQK